MTSRPARMLRPVRVDDDPLVDAVYELNQRWVPHVGSVTRPELVRILGASTLALAAVPADPVDPVDAGDPVDRRAERLQLDGFVIVMAPGADYASPNYRWFEARLSGGTAPGGFRYVDRVAVAPAAQGGGVGRLLYEAVVADARTAGAAEVTCEVNLDPPNPASQAFHRHLGFVEVGSQWTYDDTVEVQLLARRI